MNQEIDQHSQDYYQHQSSATFDPHLPQQLRGQLEEEEEYMYRLRDQRKKQIKQLHQDIQDVELRLEDAVKALNMQRQNSINNRIQFQRQIEQLQTHIQTYSLQLTTVKEEKEANDISLIECKHRIEQLMDQLNGKEQEIEKLARQIKQKNNIIREQKKYGQVHLIKMKQFQAALNIQIRRNQKLQFQLKEKSQKQQYSNQTIMMDVNRLRQQAVSLQKDLKNKVEAKDRQINNLHQKYKKQIAKLKKEIKEKEKQLQERQDEFNDSRSYAAYNSPVLASQYYSPGGRNTYKQLANRKMAYAQIDYDTLNERNPRGSNLGYNTRQVGRQGRSSAQLYDFNKYGNIDRDKERLMKRNKLDLQNTKNQFKPAQRKEEKQKADLSKNEIRPNQDDLRQPIRGSRQSKNDMQDNTSAKYENKQSQQNIVQNKINIKEPKKYKQSQQKQFGNSQNQQEQYEQNNQQKQIGEKLEKQYNNQEGQEGPNVNQSKNQASKAKNQKKINANKHRKDSKNINDISIKYDKQGNLVADDHLGKQQADQILQNEHVQSQSRPQRTTESKYKQIIKHTNYGSFGKEGIQRLTMRLKASRQAVASNYQNVYQNYDKYSANSSFIPLSLQNPKSSSYQLNRSFLPSQIAGLRTTGGNQNTYSSSSVGLGVANSIDAGNSDVKSINRGVGLSTIEDSKIRLDFSKQPKQGNKDVSSINNRLIQSVASQNIRVNSPLKQVTLNDIKQEINQKFDPQFIQSLGEDWDYVLFKVYQIKSQYEQQIKVISMQLASSQCLVDKHQMTIVQLLKIKNELRDKCGSLQNVLHRKRMLEAERKKLLDSEMKQIIKMQKVIKKIAG